LTCAVSFSSSRAIISSIVSSTSILDDGRVGERLLHQRRDRILDSVAARSLRG
jgi:hypothetical protein